MIIETGNSIYTSLTDIFNMDETSQLPSVEKSELIKICQHYANDTWAGLKRMAETPTGYPEDTITLKDKEVTSNSKTSPTNIGLFLASIIAARDIDLVSSQEAGQSIDTLLNSLESAEKYQGLFYNWYDTQTGEVSGKNDQPFISTVDNAWLATGLLTIMAGASEYSDRAKELIKQMNFSLLYDNDRNLFYGGFYPETQQASNWHYDVLNTESRIAGYLGPELFDIPATIYSHLSHPSQSHRFLSWGGSMFEALMPTLFVQEQDSPTWDKSHRQTIEAQRQYGRQNEKGYWGFSPSNTPAGDYQEAGLAELAIKEGGYEGAGKKLDVITPHALCLSLLFEPSEAVKGLQELENKFPTIYKSGFGFSDSVDVQTGSVAHSYLSLDQAMSLIAFFNLTSNNRMQQYFSSQLGGTLEKLVKSADSNFKLAA